MSMFIILQHEPNGAYEFREVDTPEEHKLNMRALSAFARKNKLKGLKLTPITKEYKLSHYWHDAMGNEIPVFSKGLEEENHAS
jgi:hypothetical protein